MKSLLSIAFLIGLTTSVMAHSDGAMVYDHMCCHDNDCAPVLKIIKEDVGESYQSKHGTVHILPQDAVRRLPSKDQRFHVCMRPAYAHELKSDDKRPMRPICIYMPELY